MRVKLILLSGFVLSLATAPATQAQYGCAATDVSSESIVVRAAPHIKANAVQSIPKEQASSLERRDTFAGGRRGDWLKIHATGLEGWVSATDVVCRMPPGQARDTIAKQAEEAIEVLKTKDMTALARLVHPVKGLRFSPIATVDAKRDVALTASQLRLGLVNLTVRLWGFDDASGAPIRLSLAAGTRRCRRSPPRRPGSPGGQAIARRREVRRAHQPAGRRPAGRRWRRHAPAQAGRHRARSRDRRTTGGTQ